MVAQIIASGHVYMRDTIFLVIITGATTRIGLETLERNLVNMLYIQPTFGQVGIETRPDSAPAHVSRIKKFIRQEFYGEVASHRITAEFITQTGNPTRISTGRSGRKLEDEFNSPAEARQTRETLPMARAQN